MNLFVSENQKVGFEKDSGNCITIGLDTQTVFYQPHEFYTGQNIQVLNYENCKKENALFVTKLIQLQMGKFNWGGNGATLGRLSRTKALLPVTSTGQIDYDFMEEYIKEVEEHKLEEYLDFAAERLNECKENARTVEQLEEKEWKPFEISEIFTFQKGNQNNMNILGDGNIPLISAKKINNGLKAFVSKNSKKHFEGNCITLNNDGDGGAGLAYYQPAFMAVDSHVTVLYSKLGLAKFSLLFLSRIISQQADRFGHAHSITQDRLKAYKLILPVDSAGNPDYSYMESYIKNLMAQKYTEYLEFRSK